MYGEQYFLCCKCIVNKKKQIDIKRPIYINRYNLNPNA